jgi:hypothetical protein
VSRSGTVASELLCNFKSSNEDPKIEMEERDESYISGDIPPSCGGGEVEAHRIITYWLVNARVT